MHNVRSLVGTIKRSSEGNIVEVREGTVLEAQTQGDPVANTAGCVPRREATSKTRLATQEPMGTVTRIGWNGCPYGPASRLTGRLAACISVATLPSPAPSNYISAC